MDTPRSLERTGGMAGPTAGGGLPRPGWRPVLGALVLALALAAGTYLRLSHIGKYGFWTDELFHVFAAISFLQDGTFHVPWDPHEYTRALPVTLLTALSFKLLGPSEWSARIVFALTNLVFILIGYRIIKTFFSRDIALIFTITTALSIFSIQMSQECRMYTLFQLSYFLMVVAFFRGFEPIAPTGSGLSPGLVSRVETRAGVSVKHLASALALAVAAASLQALTFSFVLVLFAYCIIMFLYLTQRDGFRRSLGSKYCIVLLLAGMATLVLVLVHSGLISSLTAVAVEKPSWNRWRESNVSFYVRVLTESHPISWALYPLGAFVAIHRYGRRGLFFVLSFCVLFIMHCFIFQRVSERYIFHLLPFFITIATVGVDFVLSSTLAFAGNRAAGLSSRQRSLFYMVVGLSLAIIVYPRVERTFLDTSVPKFSNWKGLSPDMIQRVKQGPSVTTDRLRFNYYFGQYPDYVIDSSDLDHVGGERVIANLADFERVMARHPILHLVTYNQHIYNDAFVSAEIREYILRRMDRVDRESDERIMVFKSRAGEQ